MKSLLLANYTDRAAAAVRFQSAQAKGDCA
jgi:hypothetical protein